MQEVFRLTLTGANRRSDDTLFEQLLLLDAAEQAALGAGAGLPAALAGVLRRRGLEALAHGLPAAASFGELYAHLALGLQRQAGHRLELAASLPRDDPGEVHTLIAYEHMGFGWRAVRLAMALIIEACPGLGWPEEFGEPFEDFDARLRRFWQTGLDTLLPVDTEVLIGAARERDLPCTKLERYPYEAAQGAGRVRENSLLRLGHCRHQRVVDGTLCFDRSQVALKWYHDRKCLSQLSEKYRFQIPYNENEYRNINTYKAFQDAAGAMGFPLAVKPRRRSHGRGLVARIRGPEALRPAYEVAAAEGLPLLLEQHVPGEAFRVLVGNHRLLAVIDSKGQDRRAEAHHAVGALAEAVSRGEQVGLLEMTVVSPDIARPLAPGHGAVVDVDCAPRLDRFLEGDSPLMRQAVEALLDWIFPPGAPTRVPLVAVTGTNGKTTTCRMVTAMFRAAGQATALVCTDGAWFFHDGGEEAWETEGDVRFQQLEDPRVEAVVQESHFGVIARAGFPWQRCDVGVVTNVTPDHIGRLGVETLDEMAELKRAVPERARTAVLNADDPRCLAMIPQLDCEGLWLTTQRADLEAVRAAAGREVALVACLPHAGEDWLVVDRRGERSPLLPVSAIPATFGGAARHNVSNAMQTVATGLALGLPRARIAEALSAFAMNFATTPGRQNLHDNGRFRILIDTSHTQDAITKLADFVDHLAPWGRRVLVFGVSSVAADALVGGTAAAAAGRFDHYVCKNFSEHEGFDARRVPSLMRASLEREGVPPEAIDEIPGEWDALERGIGMCGAGDLLVILTGRLTLGATWRRIQES